MADDLDLISLTEGYEAVNNPAASGHDEEMGRMITAISRRVDSKCGPVVVRTVTGEKHDGGGQSVWLRETPVDTITTVEEYDNTTSKTLTAETNASKPADGYLLESRRHYVRIWRRSTNADSAFPSGRQNVVVTYEAGRAENTAAVDPKFKMAAESILRRLWKRESSVWSQGGNPFEVEAGSPGFFKAVDPMITEFLNDELKPAI